MGAIAFVILVILGFLTAVIGSIVGLVDAFRVSPVWGLLSLFIPFALLVFCLKFWNRKWARNSLIMSVSGVAMMLLSTPFLGAFNAQRTSQLGDPSGETFPIEGGVVEPVPIPEAGDPGTEQFAEPLVPVAPQLAPIARADLIQSTDPNERIQQINDGRTDPFAVVPIPPAPQAVAPPPVPGGGTPAAAGPAQAGAPGAGAPGPGPGGPGSPVATAPAVPGAPGATTPATPGATPVGPGQPISPPALAPLPPLPQPEQAAAVQVSGVMTIGTQNFAVVQTSAGSQYVRAGQRISNGQVLVKRIDMRGSEPMVVLEENGIEVSRPVGALPVNEEVAANGVPSPGVAPPVQF